jgi:hypothetical protein
MVGWSGWGGGGLEEVGGRKKSCERVRRRVGRGMGMMGRGVSVDGELVGWFGLLGCLWGGCGCGCGVCGLGYGRCFKSGWEEEWGGGCGWLGV